MDAAQAKKLREPFPPEAIGKLPKPLTKDARKGNCSECGKYHGLPAVHLDYVGHAAATDRLLQVDPEWTWEPMALGPNGEPLLTNGGLWIKLTVAGVTRPGFGDGNGMKEVIGDAIRNAAMRFGVALDLWSKEDLHAFSEAAGEPARPETNGHSRRAPEQNTATPIEGPKATKEEQDKLARLIGNLAKVSDKNWDSIADTFAERVFGHGRAKITKPELEALVRELTGQLDALDKAKLKELQTA